MKVVPVDTRTCAMLPEQRKRPCTHDHTPYRGAMPCTGPLVCTMCGAMFDPRTKKRLRHPEERRMIEKLTEHYQTRTPWDDL